MSPVVKLLTAWYWFLHRETEYLLENMEASVKDSASSSKQELKQLQQKVNYTECTNPGSSLEASMAKAVHKEFGVLYSFFELHTLDSLFYFVVISKNVLCC